MLYVLYYKHRALANIINYILFGTETYFSIWLHYIQLISIYLHITLSNAEA